ncbi:hypothetical protein [Modestobacter roseus]|uniref:GAF domain-containing protein n=1 Tax=Modestobacter roseus TaxID=1181884 RepID=A0A562IXQ3_9ACTN|nr:hypothetical protein [Modestobacter roseus]MQA32755.1 hypothetical protein [Modestobacter roseus]TWH75747.1 hypothetical protein JD78_04312 [Modestobacter roseus]
MHTGPRPSRGGRHRGASKRPGKLSVSLDRFTNRGETAPADPVLSVLPSAAPDFRDTARSTVATFAAGGTCSSWLVNRIADEVYTPLAASVDPGVLAVDQPIPFGDSICHDVVRHRTDAVSLDLSTTRDPVLAAKADGFGIKHYAGIALRNPRGELIGSLCGFTERDLRTDMTGWLRALDTQGVSLSRSLSADLQRAAGDRRADLDAARRSTDATTGLPDRHGWGLLLAREEERAARLAEQVGVVLVDLGTVFTTRSARRAAHAVVETAGGRAQVARTGPRQLGMLVGGGSATTVSGIAADVGEVLRAGGTNAVTGWAMRTRLDGMIDAWWRAEDALLTNRSRALQIPHAR